MLYGEIEEPIRESLKGLKSELPMAQKLRVMFSIIAILISLQSWGFGRIGHDAVAYIAECNLTPVAKAEINKYLEGKSLVYYASFLDKVRLTPEYKYTSVWHGASVDADGKHKIWKNKHLAYIGINHEMEHMENGKYLELPDSVVTSSIKILLHIVGDMHCCGHTVFEDLSQNRSFTIGNKKYQWHKFWDGGIFEIGHRWHFKDYQEQLDRCSKEEHDAMIEGSLIDWIEENARIIRPLYDILTPDRVFDRAESFAVILKMTEISDMQILKAGYRVAHVLNSIFDPDYPTWQR